MNVSVSIADIRKEGDIFIIRMKTGSDINGKGVIEMLQTLEKMAQGVKYKLLFDTIDLEIGHISRSAYLEHISVSIAENRSGEAFIVDSLPLRMIINFYHKVIKPPFPSKMFRTEEEAKDWLNTL